MVSMSTSSTDCRLSEQVSITRSLYLSGNVVKRAELLKKNISCLQGASICIYDDLETFDKYRRVKLNVSAILSLK